MFQEMFNFGHDNVKTCSKCGNNKAISLFPKSGRKCKKCLKEYINSRDNKPNGATHKTCTECGNSKELCEFAKARAGKYGVNSKCKVCKRIKFNNWAKTDRGSKYLKEREKTTKTKAMRKKYNNSEAGKRNRKKRGIEYALRNPNKIKAKNKVNHSIEKGNFPKASTHKCTSCGVQASEYHHWSYEECNWLDVIPYCKQCHVDEHMRLKKTGASL